MASRPQTASAALTRLSPPHAPPAFSKSLVVGNAGADNRLVHADNLPALEWLREGWEGRFRCVYMDPPFNTGRAFAEYDDDRSPEEWRSFMEARLRAVRPLLSSDGVLFLEIDDSELGSAISLCDDVFGRAARVSTVTLVRSASTGHKAKNRGPVNVTDFLLIYEREPGAWRPRPLKRLRQGYDRAYDKVLVNRKEPVQRWRLEGLAVATAREAGYATPSAARRALGPAAWEARKATFAMSHRDDVVRLAQPRYEAVSKRAQREIDASKREPFRVRRLVREGFPDMLLLGGNRVLFLASKVIDTKEGPRLAEPLTNVWDDVPFQGIAREGGVVFSRNKKPERLLQRVLELATDPGDWVLDPFLGSGTTAAVAEKMGRRWVGIERGDVLESLAVPRLERVVSGKDPTGITKARDHRGGGGFSVYTQTR